MRALVAFFLLLPATAGAIEVTGTVFADRDGDGVFSAADQPLSGVILAWETTRYAVSDANGRYTLTVDASGTVWARTPDGYSPQPIWKNVDVSLGSTGFDVPFAPAQATGPVTFVDTADAHVGIVSVEETRMGLEQATALTPAPHFMTIVGDLTDRTEPGEFQMLAQARDGISLPFVPIPGNHDWYDGGVAYRAALGPPMYSFDCGGVHFIVLNMSASEAAQIAFIQKDLTYPHADVVAAFLHAPPLETHAMNLAAAGIQYLFTGHTHGNKVSHHGAMTEWNTEAISFGGLDYTPAGYRVVALVDGQMTTTHHVTVDHLVATLSFPRPGSCVDAGDVHVVVAAELGPSATQVTFALDGAAPVTLAPAGAWSYTGRVTIPAGDHTAVITATAANGQTLSETNKLCARAPQELPAASAEWPQLGASSFHQGNTTDNLSPPLRNVWARGVGGHIFGGSPVVAGGIVYVPVVDLADAKQGGIVALDLLTGEEVWSVRGDAVRNAPAYADGVLVFVTADGMVRALDGATGAEIWRYDLGAGQDELLSWLYAAPTIAEGLVYVGSQREVIAADLHTGAILFVRNPAETVWAVTLSAIAVGGGVGVGLVGRGRMGVMGFDANDGSVMWTIGLPVSNAIMSAPIIDGTRVYLTNLESHVCAVDVTTGEVLWQTKLYNTGTDFRYGIIGTPALAGGRLFVPTPNEELVALDVAHGDRLWSLKGGGTMIRPLPYGKSGAKGFTAAPAVTGDVVWIGGLDGVLRAHDVVTGERKWAIDLGTPIMSGVVPVPPYLVVGTFDGTVHVFVTDDGSHIDPTVTPPGGAHGCGCTVGEAPASPGWICVAVCSIGLAVRRRARD